MSERELRRLHGVEEGIGILTADVLNANPLDVLAGSLFQPVGSNSLLYERAEALLGSDVLLSSTVQDARETADGVELLVRQGAKEYLVQARRVLYAAPPSLSNLAPFALDKKEKAVFSQWTEDGEYVGVAEIPCIPHNLSGTYAHEVLVLLLLTLFQVTFLPSTAAPSNYLQVKDWPYSLQLDATGPADSHLFRVVLGANYTLTSDAFQTLVAQNVQRMGEAGTIGQCRPTFKAVSRHSRPLWKQSREQIEGGFVQALYGLQGHRKRWYVGYAWGAPYSSTVWGFVDTVLGRLMQDVGVEREGR